MLPAHVGSRQIKKKPKRLETPMRGRDTGRVAMVPKHVIFGSSVGATGFYATATGFYATATGVYATALWSFLGHILG